MMRKIGNRKGFTLAETMLAVLILLLVSSIVAAGIPVAKNAYEKVVLGSNAQLLLSTTVNALRDELGTAWDVQPNGTSVTYYSGDTGAPTIIRLNGNVIERQRYAGDDALDAGISKADAHPLVSNAAVTSQLCVKYRSVGAEGKNIIVFSGLSVYKTDRDGNVGSMLAELTELKIRVVSIKTA